MRPSRIDLLRVDPIHVIVVWLWMALVLGLLFLWTAHQLSTSVQLARSVQPQGGAGHLVFEERFEGAQVSGRWREDSRYGWTRYAILRDTDGNRVLRAESRGAASTLIAPLNCSAVDYPRLRWRWKAAQLPAGADLSLRRGSDAAARVYVVFSVGPAVWQKRLLNYVWATGRDPQGLQLPSAFSRHSSIIVVESGEAYLNAWRSEERNIYVDYRRAFGEEPPTVAAVALMTDSDNTRSTAVAYYDDLTLGP